MREDGIALVARCRENANELPSFMRSLEPPNEMIYSQLLKRDVLHELFVTQC
jgi:hypothetical protein